eukprot:CAMPEP_0206019678 /NCGR_PEP_ID=MMETSP1464-20131121/29564_1 /ASSEMBLY_ACC=CAM_ASM_001124 /TAXON_ID=119497 /ORGANISM="Exanthemachrysis gayraliae, Strain RCC1523" /LENGTH=184 /DNA_ID=CAMNT_0053393583 /DNA_START=36 /DNA_END=590 /DNA_ORIENTATION=+
MPGKRPHKRDKQEMITFDENARKRFITGFKRRKDERREIARKQNEEKARLARIAERKERREAMRFALSGGAVNETRAAEVDAPPERPEMRRNQHVYQNCLTTTSVTPITDATDSMLQVQARQRKDKGGPGNEASGQKHARTTAGMQIRKRQGAMKSAKAHARHKRHGDSKAKRPGKAARGPQRR